MAGGILAPMAIKLRSNYDGLIETGARRVTKHLDSFKRVIFETSIMVFAISALVQMATVELHDLRANLNESEFKGLIPVALTGVAGIVVLSSTILIFVHFLRGKTKQLKGLEVKVVSAFMKALDESPLESHTLDEKYREQLNP